MKTVAPKDQLQGKLHEVKVQGWKRRSANSLMTLTRKWKAKTKKSAEPSKRKSVRSRKSSRNN